MTRCYFENLQAITIEQLQKAQKNVNIAVAWINFLDYMPIFYHLNNNNVKIKIIINDDDNNGRYSNEIMELRNNGVKIKCIKVAGTMHHKFCIIDKRICLHGSFNWTRNANEKNNEDLTVTDENNVVSEYMLQFKALWELSKQDLKLLRKPQICEYCGSAKINICFLEQEGDYQTKVYIVKRCDCEEKIIAEENYYISVYNNFQGIYDRYREELEEAYQMGDEQSYQNIQEDMDYAVSDYLAKFRKNRLGCDIIHAVGVKAWRWLNKHDGEWCYRIIWKEKYTSNYIDNEYDIIDY